LLARAGGGANTGLMNASRTVSRRQFCRACFLAAAGPALLPSCRTAPEEEPIIDIHQHVNYGGKRDAHWHQIAPARSDAELLAHQSNMGVSRTILLPAGSPVIRPSTHLGAGNGLEGTCAGSQRCYELARAHPAEFYFGANEVPDLEDAPAVIEKYLKLGAVCIGEQKFGVECDSPQMEALYELAAEYRVPILMHWQYGSYNYGYDRLPQMLEKHPKTMFVGHAQTVWAHIDRNYSDDKKNLYPGGKITPGGWTDRYLADYPNFFADLSAGSGHNALARDPEFTRGFFKRHQDKLLFGSDCNDKAGRGPACTGWETIQTVRELAGSKAVERKLLYQNARRLYHLS
jgi:predicted TIM-barrel fold metal-dependent hydrolase